MFSRKERDFLAILVRCERAGDAAQRELMAAFPNPTYRRKLLWAIRRKAADAATDWELFADAARVESKVLPGSPAARSPPLAVDPLVPLVRGVQRLLKRRRRTTGSRSSSPDVASPKVDRP